MTAIPCQRCGCTTGQVHCYQDAAQTVAHATPEECDAAVSDALADRLPMALVTGQWTQRTIELLVKDWSCQQRQLDTLRQRHAEAVEIATEAVNGCTCDALHHKKSERHGYHEPCKVLARLNARLASSAKARLT